MLGILDRAFAIKYRSYKGLPKTDGKFKPLEIKRESPDNWFCFLPYFVYRNSQLMQKILPRTGNVYAYEIPKGTVQPNPYTTREVLNNISESALNKICSANMRDPSFLGVSLGNAPAFVLAEGTYSKGQLIAIAPGAKLPECIRDSIATSETMQRGIKMGFTFEDFQEALSVFSPLAHARSLHTRNRVYLAKHDMMIPFQSGLELVAAMNENVNKPQVNISNWKDHASLIITWRFLDNI